MGHPQNARGGGEAPPSSRSRPTRASLWPQATLSDGHGRRIPTLMRPWVRLFVKFVFGCRGLHQGEAVEKPGKAAVSEHPTPRAWFTDLVTELRRQTGIPRNHHTSTDTFRQRPSLHSRPTTKKKAMRTPRAGKNDSGTFSCGHLRNFGGPCIDEPRGRLTCDVGGVPLSKPSSKCCCHPPFLNRSLLQLLRFGPVIQRCIRSAATDSPIALR